MEDNNKIRIGITQGDINGVGYEVILKSGLCHVTAQNGNMYEIIEKALRADKSCSSGG